MEGTMATIMLFAAEFAPKYWAYCNGQLISIQQNSALFSLLGTTYGGNGIQNFALPNFQGRTAVGTGQGQGLPNVTLGEMAGTPSITLLTSNLPQHTHPVSATLVATSTAPNTDESSGAILAGANIYAAGANGQLAGVTIQSGMSGGNQPVNIQQPYLGMNFVICTQGIFPSRP
jgi:microcystin-dependent protein